MIVHFEEVGTGTVHLVHESQAGHVILVSLTPNSFRLRLNTTHGTVNHAGAVQDAHGTFHFNSEVNVPRGVNDVQTMFRELTVHATPESGRSGRRNRNPLFLFLFHPVHGGGAIMHFTELMGNARIEQNTFSGRGLTRVNVGRNPDVAITRDRSSTSHYVSPSWRRCVFSLIGKRIWLIKLETEVRESLVGFSHAVNFVTLLHGAATAFGRIQQLTS